MPSGMPRADKSRTAKVINPSPPIWISTTMTSWPKKLNVLPTSTTDSPVTVTAEVEVNSASAKVMPALFANGDHSTSAPTTISVK